MIRINGKTFHGNSVVVNNGRIIVDGKPVDDNDIVQSKNISIVVEGDINEIKADVVDTITVHGSAKTIKTTNGDVEIGGDVSGDIDTTNGNIKCGNVGGSVKTLNGNIRRN
jgi:hypothetical protein